MTFKNLKAGALIDARFEYADWGVMISSMRRK